MGGQRWWHRNENNHNFSASKCVTLKLCNVRPVLCNVKGYQLRWVCYSWRKKLPIHKYSMIFIRIQSEINSIDKAKYEILKIFKHLFLVRINILIYAVKNLYSWQEKTRDHEKQMNFINVSRFNLLIHLNAWIV